MLKKAVLLIVVSAAALVWVYGAPVSAGRPDSVVICHAAGQAGTTKYVTLKLPYKAVFGKAGHFYENGTPTAGHEDDYLGPCKETTPSTSTTTPSSTSVPPTSTSSVAPSTTVVDPTTTSSVAPTTSSTTSTSSMAPTTTSIAPSTTVTGSTLADTGNGQIVAYSALIGAGAMLMGAVAMLATRRKPV